MERYYSEIYEHFKLAYGVSDNDVDHWRRGLDHEIIVYMKNGEIICYNNNYDSFGYIEEYEIDERGDYVLDDNEYKAAFAKKLRRLMLSRRINQSQLSEATGINPATISRYMNGKNIPHLGNVIRLCRGLNCSIHDLGSFD